MGQFDVFSKVIKNMLLGAKTTESSKVYQTVVALTYLVSLNTFSSIFGKYSSQKSS